MHSYGFGCLDNRVCRKAVNGLGDSTWVYFTSSSTKNGDINEMLGRTSDEIDQLLFDDATFYRSFIGKSCSYVDAVAHWMRQQKDGYTQVHHQQPGDQVTLAHIRACGHQHIEAEHQQGRAGEALSILQELFGEGEDPLAVMGPLTSQLRKLATVGRLHFVEKMALGPAMDAANVPKWDKARISCEKQMKHLGGRRLLKLSDWLVEINYGLKGGNPLPERVQVERLVVMLARPREDAKR